MSESPDSAALVDRLRRRAERERVARHEAERLLEDKSRELWEANRRLAAQAEGLERQVVERSRYLALYGIDLADLSIYDLILDSGKLAPDELADRIVAAAKER